MLGLLCLLCACSTVKPVKDTTTKNLATVSSEVIDTSKMVREHGDLIPADTIAVVGLNFEALLDLVMAGGGYLPQTKDTGPVKEDLARFTTERIGLDITKISQALLVVTESQQAALFLEGDIALPQSEDIVESGGVRYYEPPKSHGLVFADVGRDGLLVALLEESGKPLLEGLLAKKVDALAGTPRHLALAQDLEEAGEGVISIGITLGEGPMSAMAKMQLPLPLTSAVISISEDLSVVLRGEPAALEQIKGLAQATLGEFKSKLTEEMAQLANKDTAEGIVTIIAFHIVSNITEVLEPKVEGDKLTLFVEDLRPLQVIPLAAIGIPAFVKYVKQSKTSEAPLNLKTMADGAAAYYQVDHYSEAGVKLPRHLPESTGISHPQGCCGAGSKCKADPSIWSSPEWSVFKFAVAKDHYYTYEAVKQDDFNMVFIARGDLDCDGIQSVFKIKMSVNPEGAISMSPVFLENPANELE